MDQFIVSARKYRPATFDSVVGQRHISETLKNAIKSSHLAQAFLFSGPRGVGKTTCARILAKTINCFDRTENIEPCDECESCKSFNEGHSLNVYELDAASNNSVDDIRKLIDQVRFAPQLGSKKVYIIDEVHMLSAQAFNAFLKTLEEPPSHAIFILATTEKHKIIPTILSRCQIFDFNRIELEDMVRQLANIAKKEKVNADNDALHLIAQKSDGSLRDALSMFDQMVTYAGNDLSYESVVENLSILSTEYFFDLTDHLVTGDISFCLNLFNEILHKGFEGQHFIQGLAEHMRNLLVAQDHKTIDLLLAGPQIRERYREQTLKVSSEFVIKSLNLINKADLQYKTTRNQRLLVELTLINLARLTGKKTDQTAVQPEDSGKKKPLEESKPALKEEPAIPQAEQAEKAKEEKKVVAQVAEPVIKDREDKEAAIKKEVDQVVEKKQLKDPEPEEPSASPETTNEIPSQKAQIQENKPSTVAAVNEESLSEKAEIKEPKQNTKPGEKPAQKRTFGSDIPGSEISISSFMKEEEETEEGEIDDENREIRFKDKINEEKFRESWKSLMDDYDKQGKISLKTSLSKYDPILHEDHQIEITYDNKSQAEAIQAERLKILEKLRKELRNDLLQLKLVKSKQTDKKAYTASEKLEKLIEKNPSIDLLKNKLDLDLN